MGDENDKATECCREARLCVEVAERVSIREERERMIELAQEWLVLAEQVQQGGAQQPAAAPQQQPAQQQQQPDRPQQHEE